MRLEQLIHTRERELDITSIAWDTRRMEKGALFFALPGARDDGARYIDQALAQGAAAVVCAEGESQDPRCIFVEDPRKALAQASVQPACPAIIPV